MTAKAPRRLPAVALLACVAVAVAIVAGGGELNYDLAFALTWGQDTLAGRAPDFELALAPTAHPLTTGLGILAAPFSPQAGVLAMHWTAYLSLVAVLVLVFALGRELAGWPAGLVAAVPVAISPAFLTATSAGFQDVTAAALILGAVLLVMRAPRCGAAVLVLLALAGLLRPEAWGLAAAYWLYMLPGASRGLRVRLAVLAATGPLGWALVDLAITGQPLLSLTHTRDSADSLRRVTGLGEVPGQLRVHLDRMLGPAVLAGAVAGVAASFARPARFAAVRVPIATGVLLGVAFAALGAAEVSLLARYLLVPGALLAVLFAVALLGWRDLGASRGRTAWMLGAAALALGAVALVPHQISMSDDQLRAQRVDGRVVDDLLALVDEPAARAAAARCGPLAVTHHVTRPYVALQLGRPVGDIALADAGRALPAAVVAPASADSASFLSRGADTSEPPSAPPATRRLAGNASWELWSVGCR